MTLGLTAIDQFLDSLDNKASYYVVNKLLSTLVRWQLEKVSEKSEKLIENILLEQENSFLYDIRGVNNNYYAYIKRIGREYPNLYLGVMRFRQGKIYRITHKTKDKEKIVRGLGLEQKGNKTYLKIEFIYPEAAIRSYLFYDPALDVPRLPQQSDIEGNNENIAAGDRQAIISTPEQNIWGDKSYRRAVTSREDWSAIFIKKDWIVEEIETADGASPSVKRSRSADESAPSNISSPQPPDNIPLPLPNKKQIAVSNPPKTLHREKGIQPRQELVSIQVGKNFSLQVEMYLQQWVAFTKLLPNNTQWQLGVETKSLKLLNQSDNKVIVEYDRASQRLSARSVRVLHALLFETISNVANSKLVPKEQQSLAQRWLVQLRNPPFDREQELLTFIFNL